MLILLMDRPRTHFVRFAVVTVIGVSLTIFAYMCLTCQHPVNARLRGVAENAWYLEFPMIHTMYESSAIHFNVNDSDPQMDPQSCTSARHSTYRILNQNKKYTIGERVQVLIGARDHRNRPQRSGGAYFRAKLASNSVKASSRSDGEIVDFNNGSYLAEFVIRWPGKVNVLVMLVQGDCASRTIDRIAREYPNRGTYIGIFKSGSLNEATTCNIDHVASQEQECDFTDPATHIGWFCKMPRNLDLTCEHWWWHKSDNNLIYEQHRKYLRHGESAFFKASKTYLKCTKCTFTVADPASNDASNANGRYSWQMPWNELPPCLPGSIRIFDANTSGYYFRDKWYSTRCRNQIFDVPALLKCLKDKTLFINGDSTVRQWYSYLAKVLEMKSRRTIKCISHSFQSKYNISLFYKFHGAPTRGSNGGSRQCALGSVPHMLDHLDFSPHVYILAMGAHVSVHSKEYFAQRMSIVGEAVDRLLARSPRTVFLLKSANTREFGTLPHLLSNNEWYIYQQDRIFRKTFANRSDVAIVDAWDMTVAQFHPDNVHVVLETLKNQVNLAMSYVCPK